MADGSDKQRTAPARSGATSIDAYIAEQSPDVRPILEQIRATIHKAAPDLVEKIAYAIPTFDVNGRHVVHFAAFKNHIGFFPTPRGIGPFDKEIDEAGWKTSKGTIQFPLDQPMPLDFIRRVTEMRHDQELSRKK